MYTYIYIYIYYKPKFLELLAPLGHHHVITRTRPVRDARAEPCASPSPGTRMYDKTAGESI